MKIHNMPEDHDKYIVARVCDNELWFWGSFETETDAKKVAEEMDAVYGEDEE